MQARTSFTLKRCFLENNIIYPDGYSLRNLLVRFMHYQILWQVCHVRIAYLWLPLATNSPIQSVHLEVNLRNNWPCGPSNACVTSCGILDNKDPGIDVD